MIIAVILGGLIWITIDQVRYVNHEKRFKLLAEAHNELIREVRKLREHSKVFEVDEG